MLICQLAPLAGLVQVITLAPDCAAAAETANPAAKMAIAAASGRFRNMLPSLSDFLTTIRVLANSRALAKNGARRGGESGLLLTAAAITCTLMSDSGRFVY